MIGIDARRYSSTVCDAGDAPITEATEASISRKRIPRFASEFHADEIPAVVSEKGRRRGDRFTRVLLERRQKGEEAAAF